MPHQAASWYWAIEESELMAASMLIVVITELVKWRSVAASTGDCSGHAVARRRQFVAQPPL